MLKGFSLTIFLLLCASSARAADIYVAQASAGGNTGANCANARANSSLVAGDWSPGNTIHLCATLTSQVSALGSGTSGNPITIQFEPGAKISQTACGSGGCIDVHGRSWWTIDGGTACGIIGFPGPANPSTACNGIIEATGNGSGSGNGESIGINAIGGTSHGEIRNVQIRNMYVFSSPTDNPPNLYYCINVVGSNISIHNNIEHDCYAGWVGNVPTSSVTFTNNEVYNANWSMFVSGNSTVAGISTITVSKNDFHDWINWDTSVDRNHHDGCFAAGNDNLADGVTLFTCNQNYMHGAMTAAATCVANSGSCMTAMIFVNDANHSTACNNLLAPSSGFVNSGLIYFWSPGALQSNDLVCTNTIIGTGGTSGVCVALRGDTSLTYQDNVASNCPRLINVYTSMPSTTFTAFDHNTYQNGSLTNAWSTTVLNTATTYNTLAAWQAGLTGAGLIGDTASQATTGSLGLNANSVPQAGSLLIGAGANLTSLGITTDLAGVGRPGSGAWTSGALNQAVTGVAASVSTGASLTTGVSLQ